MRPRTIIVALHVALTLGILWLARDVSRYKAAGPAHRIESAPPGAIPDARPGRVVHPRRGMPVFRTA